MKTKQAETAEPSPKNGNGNKVELKSVKHTFTLQERDDHGSSLARSIGALRGIESELEQVKASYKARTAEAEARIDNISTALTNGFEMRNERCRVVLFPKERIKRFFLETTAEDSEPVSVEDMTADDWQADLIEAESKFDCREEVQIFQPTEKDRAVLVVGRFDKNWFAALRVTIGKHALNERLDSEQPCCKKRYDMVKRALKRFNEWATETLGKDTTAGFQNGINSLLQAHKERDE